LISRQAEWNKRRVVAAAEGAALFCDWPQRPDWGNLGPLGGKLDKPACPEGIGLDVMETCMTLRLCLATVVALSGTATLAATPDYSDDRSTPVAVVASLYNALNRQEYLRAWSYFGEGAVADYPSFRDGYQDTMTVDVAYGAVQSDGAAGTIYSTVPVAIAAHHKDGSVAFFAGCYTVAQVQPALQDTPPFRPIEIRQGHLHPAKSMDVPTDACSG
jgi:hypothetical protein